MWKSDAKFLLMLGVGCGVAALFPETALLAVREHVLNMRAPDTAPQVAQWLLGACAVTFWTMFAAWRWILETALQLIRRLVELQSRSFWTLVCVCTALPRLLVALVLSYQPTSDALWLHRAATALANGEGLAVDGTLTAYHPPGYPFLLSLTYRLFGPNFNLAWIWGILSTAGILFAIHFIAQRLYGNAVARLATLFAALYPALVLMTGQVLSDLVFVAGLLLLAGFVLACTPYRVANSVAIGIGVALLMLTRGVAIGLVVIIPFIWYLRQPDPRRFALSLILVAATFSACVMPWMLRNQAVFGHLTFGTNIGNTAYLGNHEGARGGGSPPLIEPTIPPEVNVNEAERDRALLRMAFAFVVSHPGEAAAIIPGKLLNLYLLETQAATSLFQGEHPSPRWMKFTLYGLSQFVYLLFLILFCVRLGDLFTETLRPRGAQWAGWLISGYFTLLCLVFLGQDRYRLPILPWILIEAAAVLSRAASEAGRNKPSTPIHQRE